LRRSIECFRTADEPHYCTTIVAGIEFLKQAKVPITKKGLAYTGPREGRDTETRSVFTVHSQGLMVNHAENLELSSQELAR
jgi:hypothetical protein